MIDRREELIINVGGGNMVPIAIDEALMGGGPPDGRAVAMAVRDGRHLSFASPVLDSDGGAARAGDRGLAGADAALGGSHVGQRLSRIAQITRERVLPVVWEPGPEELARTGKLKRKVVTERHARESIGLCER